MGKRIDKDPTMELSTSQLVAEPPPGDVSVWKQVVVDTEQFAPRGAPRGRRRWILLLVVLLVLVGAVSYVLLA